MLSVFLFAWCFCCVLVHGVPHPIAPGGVTAGVPCSIIRYETLEVVNLTATDPNRGWRRVNGDECVTTSTSCKLFLSYSAYSECSDLLAACQLTNEQSSVTVSLDFGGEPAFDLYVCAKNAD